MYMSKLINLKWNLFHGKRRSGAAVLETVILIVAAIVIVGAIIVFFVGKGGTEGGFLSKIFKAIENLLNLNPAQ